MVSDSFILKHYTLLNSLSRYAEDVARSHSQLPRKRLFSSSEQEAQNKARKLDRLKQRYPVGEVWNYSWPLPLPQLPAHSQTPSERVFKLVEHVVRDTFDEDYATFRSPQWAKQHRIRKDHLERIVVDPNEVHESATAANALVETVLNRMIAGIKKGAIGSQKSPNSAGNSGSPGIRVHTSFDATSSQPQEAPSSSSSTRIDSTIVTDPELDDKELDKEINEDGQYAMHWKELLAYLESTVGSSKTAQWRNWHLLNAIAKTRQRCEQLFGHQ